jgi:predicted AlkP superfamily phosphohydrolase/phosphomutase
VSEVGDAKLLVIGFDSGASPLITAWAGDGTLPHIAALMRTGLVCPMKGVEALYHGATWPSFYTSKNPGRHGIWWLDHLRPGTYELLPLEPENFAHLRPVWEVLSDAGRRVCVLDVPLTVRSKALNGIQTVEWGQHDSLWSFSAYPTSLRREILRRFGPHPAPRFCDTRYRRTSDQYTGFAEQLGQGAAVRAELTRTLLSEHPWDFAIQVFSEAHCAGHQLWHTHDPSHPSSERDELDPETDLIQKVYVAIDAAIGEIVAGVDEDTTVMVVALHGIDNHFGSSPILPEILKRLGVSTPATPLHERTTTSGGSGLLGRIAAAYHLLPGAIRGPLYELRHVVKRKTLGRGATIPIDPSRSLCFFVPTGPATAGIRLNLVGREPAGILEPGAKEEAFCAQLTEDLLAIIDPETGKPLAARVQRAKDLFQGSFLDRMPDLLVEWNQEVVVGSTILGNGKGSRLRGTSARIGTVEFTSEHSRSGDHRIEGICIARGPHIRPGRLDRTVSTLDLAPTFTRILGCDLPEADGEPIPELLS